MQILPENVVQLVVHLPSPTSECAQTAFTHGGLKHIHGGTAAVCWTANATVHVCNTQMHLKECTPNIQPPNTSYKPRLLQGDHRGNTKQNLHLAAVHCNGPDRNQYPNRDYDWTIETLQVTKLNRGKVFTSDSVLY